MEPTGSDDTVIDVADVWYRYPVGSDWALRGLSFALRRGEFVGIIGSTGAGKSTLCLTLNGLIPHYHRGTFRGTVRVRGHDTRSTSVAELTANVGLVFQDADAQLIMSTVEEECTLGPLNQGLSRKEARAAAYAAIETLEIAHLAKRPPHTLSGGQKQRAAIAAALATNPEVLILDEATSELDALTVHKIFGLCSQLNRTRHTTIAVVSHEMELLARHAQRLLVVHEGQIVLDGPPRDVFRQVDVFQQAGLRRPQVAELALRLGPDHWGERFPLTEDEATAHLRQRLAHRTRSNGVLSGSNSAAGQP
jgi:energy-coupling factor transport system ATP-binding protein